MDILTAIACIVLLAGEIFIGWMMAYYNSYSKEKGKNVATKEDIAEITQKIESVKSEFTQQTERLKSQLTLLTNVKSDIYSLERKAIIDANEKLYLLMSHILEMPALEDNEDIDRYLKTMDVRFREHGNSEALMQLFIDDNHILESFRNISDKVFNMQGKKMKLLYEIQRNNRKIGLNKKELDILSRNTEIELDEISKSYIELLPDMQEFRANCREYIYSKAQTA